MTWFNRPEITLSMGLLIIAFIYATGRRGYDIFMSLFMLLAAQHLFIYAIAAAAFPQPMSFTITSISAVTVIVWLLLVSRK